MEIEIKLNIAEKIEEYSKKYGTTKSFVAKKAGMSKQALYSLLNSPYPNPTLETLIRIAYALDCKIVELFDYTIHPDIE